ncbi:RNI-like protein [Neolentinus lepideus HHB14362 ss-1]|uniref:RNI-like protein n=1 Tax=Neolentinus lepideus HHB14362 ss-1 TaxID=1314782 RepID=A0A165V7U7_9AGAM|nr:RNI-like protein [Neolentinus lepideus HHB14362 ss-1]
MRTFDRLPTREERPYVRHLLLTQGAGIQVSDDDLADILATCNHLETAFLSGVPDLSDRTLVVLASAAVHLEGIDLTSCKEVTDVGVCEIAAQCAGLQWIRLNGVVGVRDPSVSLIAKTIPHLSELELCDLPLLTASSVRDIWMFSRKLRRFRLSRCPQLTDQAFPAPGNGVSSVSLTTMSGAGKGDRSEPASWLTLLPPLILQHTAENLRVLDVSYCNKLTDRAIEGIVQHAPRIQTLVLSGCTSLTDAAIERVCNLGDFLDVLMLAHVSNITDKALVQLSRSCTKLRCVDLAFCRRVTDLGVSELASLPNIRRLNLIGLRKITDNALFFIAELNSTLERLYLSHCDRITLDAVRVLLTKLESLRHLTATGIPAFKRKGVHRFSEKPPLGFSEQDTFFVFSGQNVRNLRKFLDKEHRRRREAEDKCIPFTPRSDDAMDLY